MRGDSIESILECIVGGMLGEKLIATCQGKENWCTSTIESFVWPQIESDFNLFFKVVLTSQEITFTNPSTLPMKRKAPRCFEVGTCEGYHSSTVEELHYYECHWYY